MPDTRPRHTTNKPINLHQLDEELGGHGLSAGGSLDELFDGGVEVDIVVVEDSPVTLEQLCAAIDAHVAVPIPTRAERVAEIVNEAEDWRAALTGLAAEGLI